MLNLPVLSSPVVLNAEELVACRELVSSAYKFLFLPDVSHLYN